jgi:hypothetical protein
MIKIKWETYIAILLTTKKKKTQKYQYLIQVGLCNVEHI